MKSPSKIASGVIRFPAGAAYLAAAFLLLLMNAGEAPSQTGAMQPIAYSHKAHVGSAGMTCVDCHVNVEMLSRASIPNIDVCQTCHNDEPLSNSPEEAKVLQYVKDEKAIPWLQIYTVPDHVYFSHRRHVFDGAVECSACHGKIAEMAEPISKQAIPVTMNNCIACHKQRKASTDCLACHR